MSEILVDTYDWFKKARPEPTEDDFHNQMGVHFEEVHEMLQELMPFDPDTDVLLANAKLHIHAFAEHLKKNHQSIGVPEENRIRYLDSLCDQIVTATGCAYVDGLDIVSAMMMVNKSNYSKFDNEGNPIFNEDKKVIKGPNYVPADLSDYV